MRAGQGSAKSGDVFWGEIISRTAIGAGADATVTEAALPELVPTLMHRFSSDEGYELYKDVKPSRKPINALDRAHAEMTAHSSKALSIGHSTWYGIICKITEKHADSQQVWCPTATVGYVCDSCTSRTFI